jgi:hypothetical protein
MAFYSAKVLGRVGVNFFEGCLALSGRPNHRLKACATVAPKMVEEISLEKKERLDKISSPG